MAIERQKIPPYTAVVRTLGKAGEKYQALLDSLRDQDFPPEKIIVYLAEGSPEPKETIGREQIVRVPRGMVAQRALPYDEVSTDWILFLDDDISIEPDGVSRLFKALEDYGADVVVADTFPHSGMSLKDKLIQGLTLSVISRFGGRERGYRVNILGTDCYNPRPGLVGWSTTGAGNAFLCRKSDFLALNLEEEMWLDQSPYAIPDDKVMFFKMHCQGLRILTHYLSGFVHLDAETAASANRAESMAYSSERNNTIFYHRYVLPNIPAIKHPIARLLHAYHRAAMAAFHFITESRAGIHRQMKSERRRGRADAKQFLKHDSQR